MLALSATARGLTGCAIGGVLGVAIGTALGWDDFGAIALAVDLVSFFGYLLTMLPLLRSGLALGAVLPLAFASDAISTAVMEVVDDAIILLIPGAMEAGLGSFLFWGSLAFALVVACWSVHYRYWWLSEVYLEVPRFLRPYRAAILLPAHHIPDARGAVGIPQR